MNSTLVIQSCSPAQQTGWMQSCLASVRHWADTRGYDYRFVGDEIFDLVPDWYRLKVGSKLPVATDYARLILLQQALAQGYQQALWLDADVLVLDQSMQLDFAGSCAFGQEVWVQERDGKMQSRHNIHNAVAVFRSGCVLLPFLLHCVESVLRRVNPLHIAPQLAGPKLLQALHPLFDFALLPEVGALSPAVVAELCQPGQKGEGEALRQLLKQSVVLPQAVNLCASLITPAQAQTVIESLQSTGLSSGHHN
jgi:hypothetical protein